MNVARRYLVVLCIILTAISSFGEVRFDGLDLSADNSLLFRATSESPGSATYETLFRANVDTRELEQLTYYPERVLLTGDGRQYQVQNRFGVFRSDDKLESMHVVEAFPSFVNGAPIPSGKINSVAASPDGAYLLYLSPISEGYADLVLYSTESQEETTITERIEFTLDDPPAKWSPDSRFFVYVKKGVIYYYSIEQLEEDRLIAEDFRSIGKGGVANVKWGSNSDLYLLSDTLVYRIKSVEFFTRSLYANLLDIGNVVGKIPFQFDPNFDEFWISPDGYKILLAKGGRNIFLFFLQADDYLSTGGSKSLPSLFLPRNTRVRRVLWSTDDSIIMLTGSIVSGATQTSIFELDLLPVAESYSFVETDESGVLDMVLSGNERYMAVLKKDKVIVREFDSRNTVLTVDHVNPMKALWHSRKRLIIAGAYRSEVVDVETGERTIICLSQPGEYGFDAEEERIAMSAPAGRFIYDDQKNGVVPANGIELRAASVSSDSYRAYLEGYTSGNYRNMVMIRNITEFGTEPLFEFPERSYEPFPEEDEKVDFVHFTHGSRIRRREVSLVFNAIDTVEGLTEVLNELAAYDLRATFFLNGEFIRRHPGAVREIAESGHEVGSLFFAYFNMTDADFRIEKEFIKQGLARNEDDYFVTTGKELSLLWHAPYYYTNPDIIEASQEMSYMYIGRDVDPLDWVAKNERSMSTLYLPTASIIERIIKRKKPGSIIPIRIGKPEPGRDDYLFHRLDTLLNGLIERGYDIVPISTLIEHAR